MDPRIDVLLEMLARYRTELSTALEKVPVDRRRFDLARRGRRRVIEHRIHRERDRRSYLPLPEAPRSESDAFDRAQFDQTSTCATRSLGENQRLTAERTVGASGRGMS
jgi:hypothetical protein